MNYRHLNLLKRLIFPVFLMAISLSFLLFPSSVSAVEHEEIRDGLQQGEVRVTKSAEPVEGMVNQWDVTVKVEGRNIFPPPDTDIVLVIDNSNSMRTQDDGWFTPTRMDKAKSAASKFIEQVLQEGYNNRVGIVTFGGSGTRRADLESYEKKNDLLTIINGGWWGIIPDFGIQADGGGTHTQEGIRMGMQLLEEQAVASRRILVLISDGVPTYSYQVEAPYTDRDYMINDTANNRYVTSENIPEEGFRYPWAVWSNRIGNGSQMFLGNGNLWFPNSYISMGNNAISESNIWKGKTNTKLNGPVATDVYTIGVDMDSSDEESFIGYVDVEYQDEAGNVLDTRTLSGEVGIDSYETEKLDFAGYTFKSVTGTTSGKFGEETIKVVYTYTKITKSNLSETTTATNFETNLAKNNFLETTSQTSESEENDPILPYASQLGSTKATSLVASNGSEVLKRIASKPNMCFSVNGNGLERALAQIGNEILSAVKDGTVTDPMGEGFELAEGATNIKVSQGSYTADTTKTPNTIKWDVGTLTVPVSDDPDEDIMYATMTYRINANQGVLGEGVMSSDGYAKTNGVTKFNYIDSKNVNKEKEFVVPSVKPTIVSLKKLLLDSDGNTVTNSDESFKINLDEYGLGIAGHIIKANEEVKIVHPWKADTKYSIEEILDVSQEYDVSIAINGQTTTGTQSNLIFQKIATENFYEHQNIIVTNKVKGTVDPKDRYLYIRQCVVDPNSDLVIPSKGFYVSVFAESRGSMMNLISGSTTNNLPTNVTTSLFTKYKLPAEYDDFNKLEITDSVPEYYEQIGYVVTKDSIDVGNNHISTNTTTFISQSRGSIADYTDTNENWVTIFITPKLGSDDEDNPRPYSWDYKINQFG
ncbi:VWA domain-containing protein [Enterococcus sp. LJL51]|uniref:VWA domain-containing protein n=1 Tax=Enterococcus sp. LJL51 TaxID=3416656 RepID=UPI003CEFC10A